MKKPTHLLPAPKDGFKLPRLIRLFADRARSALGNDGLSVEALFAMTDGVHGSLTELRAVLRRTCRAFHANGGRGVGLAEKIDALVVAIELAKIESRFGRSKRAR